MGFFESDYERGQRHGNETKFASPPSILDNLGGQDYVAGKQNAFDQRCDEAGLFGSTEKKDYTSKKSSESTNNNSSSSSSYYNGSSDGIGVGGWIFLIVVGLIAIGIVSSIIDNIADNNYHTPKPGFYYNDLPAGLKPTDNNFVRNPGFFNHDLGKGYGGFIVWLKHYNPNATYHVYKSKNIHSKWEEVAITKILTHPNSTLYPISEINPMGLEFYTNPDIQGYYANDTSDGLRVVVMWND